MGFCYAQGTGVSQNYTEAVKWYRRAAAQEDAQAQHNLGYAYFNGQGVRQDYGLAVEWFRKAVQQGYAPSQYELGLCYSKGFGVPQNEVEAYAWWTVAASTESLAAEGLSLLAERMTARQLREGLTRAKELRAELQRILPDQSFLALKGMAEIGDPEAQTLLGLSYFGGRGVATNYSQAVYWWRQAAGQNNAVAQYNLGVAYDRGLGVRQNGAEAVQYYLKAARQNHPDAQFNLAACYYNGTGVEQDYVEAYAWADLAAETHTKAAKNRDDLGAKMSPEQMARAKKRAPELRAEIAKPAKKPL